MFLSGGHEKGVRQVIDSPIVQKSLALYFPQTLEPSNKVVTAICYGVLRLAEATLPDSKSVLHDATTTALPGTMEQGIFWETRLFWGDYYKTHGAGSDSVETAVRTKLDDPGKRWNSSLLPMPQVLNCLWVRSDANLCRFVVEDDEYNYVSGRFPPDVELLAEKAVALVNGAKI